MHSNRCRAVFERHSDTTAGCGWYFEVAVSGFRSLPPVHRLVFWSFGGSQALALRENPTGCSRSTAQICWPSLGNMGLTTIWACRLVVVSCNV